MAIHLKFFVDCRSRQASFAMTNSVFICRAAEESSTTFASGKSHGSLLRSEYPAFLLDLIPELRPAMPLLEPPLPADPRSHRIAGA